MRKYKLDKLIEEIKNKFKGLDEIILTNIEKNYNKSYKLLKESNINALREANLYLDMKKLEVDYFYKTNLINENQYNHFLDIYKKIQDDINRYKKI